MKSYFALAACLLHLVPVVMAGEILLHSGPVISTPALEIHSPHAPRQGTGKSIRFIKEFHIDAQLLPKLPPRVREPNDLAVDARRATDLATRSVFLGDASGELEVTAVEHLTAKIGASREVDYYLISMTANGSLEHRVVLMDATVLRPRLRQIRAGQSATPPENNDP